LFSREGPRPVRDPLVPGGPGTGTVTPPLPYAPEANIAVRGLVVENTGSFAFLEYLDSYKPEVVQLGDKVARGKVVAITLSELVYEADGKKTKVPIGYTFTGQPAPTATSLLSSYSSSPPSTGSAAAAPFSFNNRPPFGSSGQSGPPGAPSASPSSQPSSGAIMSLEEAMRRRRAEQGGAR
jgi:hypothetical protein